MTISSVSNYVAPAPLVQSSQTTGTSGHGGHGHHHHVKKSRDDDGGGQMQQALTQALQSLGLSAPASTTGTTASSTGSSSSSTGTPASSDRSTTATSGSGNVKQDMHDFMHALFQAVKAENTLSPSSPSGSSADPKSAFASGLAALITQVSNGSAPAGVQSAFNNLVSDLQSATPAATAPSGTGGSTTAGEAASRPSLQALLSALQQDLGYGSTASPSATGNVVSAQA